MAEVGIMKGPPGGLPSLPDQASDAAQAALDMVQKILAAAPEAISEIAGSIA